MQLYLALSAVLASGGQQPLTALQEADAELASLAPDTAKTKVAIPPARWSTRLGMCPGCAQVALAGPAQRALWSKQPSRPQCYCLPCGARAGPGVRKACAGCHGCVGVACREPSWAAWGAAPAPPGSGPAVPQARPAAPQSPRARPSLAVLMLLPRGISLLSGVEKRPYRRQDCCQPLGSLSSVAGVLLALPASVSNTWSRALMPPLTCIRDAQCHCTAGYAGTRDEDLWCHGTPHLSCQNPLHHAGLASSLTSKSCCRRIACYE